MAQSRDRTSQLTQDILKSLFSYDPETGIFTKHRGFPAGTYTERGYNRLSIRGKPFYGHRLAFLYMTGRWPEHFIDHINGKPWDNRWSNLREVTHQQNLCNTKRRKNNTSGFKGVSWHKTWRKYQVYITKHGKTTFLGLFHNPDEAHAAYVKAAKEIHQEFRRVE